MASHIRVVVLARNWASNKGSQCKIMGVILRERPPRGALRKYPVFKEVEDSSKSALYLISFDLPSTVAGRVVAVRRTSVEYSRIKERLLWMLCGRVGPSTYICPTNVTELVSGAVSEVKLCAWAVVPYNDLAVEAVRVALTESLQYICRQCEGVRPWGKGFSKAERLLRQITVLTGSPSLRKVEAILGYRVTPWLERLRERLSELVMGDK